MLLTANVRPDSEQTKANRPAGSNLMCTGGNKPLNVMCSGNGMPAIFHLGCRQRVSSASGLSSLHMHTY